jgi:small-conductance mechanosensitive channel
MPGIWLFAQWIGLIAAERMGWPDWLLEITVSLLTAWLVIRFAATFIADPLWSRIVEAVAWTIAALNIVDLVDPTIRLLDELAIQFGALRLSALLVIKGVLSVAVLLWGAVLLSDMVERRLGKSRRLTPSVQVLFSKLIKAILVTIAVVAALNSVGIDLTGFAVFTGALGLGIGFGLQKVVSNLISGVILLLDRSVKPGDVIAVGNTYGWVNTMSARYVSLITRDGIEHLIPNEDLITQRVENWSYSNNLVRIRIPFGVSYRADPYKVRDIAVAAAADNPRVLKTPAPLCNMKEFGDSSVNFEILAWINDPVNGVANLRGQVLFALWDRLHEEGVEIPFPQRDLHLRSAEPIPVRIVDPAAAAPHPPD